MKIAFANVIGFVLLTSASPVSAYTITGHGGGPCTDNGATCDVHCNNRQRNRRGMIS